MVKSLRHQHLRLQFSVYRLYHSATQLHATVLLESLTVAQLVEIRHIWWKAKSLKRQQHPAPRLFNINSEINPFHAPTHHLGSITQQTCVTVPIWTCVQEFPDSNFGKNSMLRAFVVFSVLPTKFPSHDSFLRNIFQYTTHQPTYHSTLHTTLVH